MDMNLEIPSLKERLAGIEEKCTPEYIFDHREEVQHDFDDWLLDFKTLAYKADREAPVYALIKVLRSPSVTLFRESYSGFVVRARYLLGKFEKYNGQE